MSAPTSSSRVHVERSAAYKEVARVLVRPSIQVCDRPRPVLTQARVVVRRHRAFRLAKSSREPAETLDEVRARRMKGVAWLARRRLLEQPDCPRINRFTCIPKTSGFESGQRLEL